MDAPFGATPNASSPTTYALAESLAMLAERDGPSGLQRLCHWASQTARAQYAALYAFKYLGMRHSTWLTRSQLELYACGNPYDRMVVTGLLHYLALAAAWTARFQYSPLEALWCTLYRGTSAPRASAPT